MSGIRIERIAPRLGVELKRVVAGTVSKPLHLLERLQTDAILGALTFTGGNVSSAAQHLGLLRGDSVSAAACGRAAGQSCRPTPTPGEPSSRSPASQLRVGSKRAETTSSGLV